MTLTAVDKLKQLLVYNAVGELLSSPGEIAARFAALEGDRETDFRDVMEEVRGGEAKTGLDCEYSRHFETEAVAAEMLDGSWVGWTHFFGGGKYGDPERVPWVDDAYPVTMTEVLEPVKKFARG